MCVKIWQAIQQTRYGVYMTLLHYLGLFFAIYSYLVLFVVVQLCLPLAVFVCVSVGLCFLPLSVYRPVCLCNPVLPTFAFGMYVFLSAVYFASLFLRTLFLSSVSVGAP